MRFIPQFEPMVDEQTAQAVADQMRTGFVGCGKKVEEFEERLGEISGARFNITTTSGTVALIMAIKALIPMIPEGAKILFPDYTFLAGANAARFLGHKIRLVDIKESTLCMDPDLIEGAYEKERWLPSWNCGAIFVNHNGYTGEDVQKTRKICDKIGLKMIEDSSQCLGIKGAGLTGAVGIYSFSVPKIITTGQGGAVFTNDENLAIELKRIRDHGGEWRTTKTHDHLGVNFKFNDILAAYGISQLNNLEAIKERRKKIWGWYSEEIGIYQNDSAGFSWMVVYKSQKADKIIDALKDKNIQAVKYYKPVHTNQPYKSKFHQDSFFPVSIKMADELVYLPSSTNLAKEEVKRICKIIKEVENEK